MNNDIKEYYCSCGQAWGISITGLNPNPEGRKPGYCYCGKQLPGKVQNGRKEERQRLLE